MTEFVWLPPADYSGTAFNNFNASKSEFDLDNARAMIWTSQLAYDTDQTIDAVANRWGFSSATPFVGDNAGLGGAYDTRGFFGERDDAVILAFGGTDPGVWKNWDTDVRFRLDPATNTHSGIQAALKGVTGNNQKPDYVGQAVSLSKQSDKPLWITGHSLGGALAVLAAQYVVSNGGAPKAIYTFGMPRPGGVQFQAAYNNDNRLGRVTYRFVHGLDVVSRIAPSVVGVGPLAVNYRHVGRVIQCDSARNFDPAVSPLSDIGSDEPSAAGDYAGLRSKALQLLEAGWNLPAILNDLGPVAPVSPPGPGLFGPAFVFLPLPIRDHLQDRYWTALTP
jgi:triacylglycerol lipase